MSFRCCRTTLKGCSPTTRRYSRLVGAVGVGGLATGLGALERVNLAVTSESSFSSMSMMICARPSSSQMGGRAWLWLIR